MFKTKQIENKLDKVFDGVNVAANVIKSTMGAKGKSVIIYDGKDIRFTKDGVSVAKSIKLTDPIEDIGAKLVINSADKTVKNVGDGTTATSVMLQAFVNSYIKLLRIEPNINTNNTLKLIGDLLSDVYEVLDSESRKVEKVSEIASIASISSNSKELGQLIAEIYEQTGFDSYIGLEKSPVIGETQYTVEEGIDFDSPYVHPAFINEPNKTCVFNNAYVYITNEYIKYVDQYEQLLDEAFESGTPLVIMSPHFSSQFIKYCVMNKVQKRLKICLIKLPGHGRDIEDNIKDMTSYLTDGNTCEKIVVSDYNFVIYNKEKDSVQKRVNTLKQELDSANNDYDRDRLFYRIHKLQGSTATLFAGGNTEKAMDEEYDRLEDALGAVRGALRFGYSKGGGISLFNISRRLKYSDDMKFAAGILKEVLNAPLTTILNNGDYNLREITNLIDQETDEHGFNVATGEIVNVIKDGIIDPTLVLKESLKNSFSSFKLLINTEFVLHNVI